ncbi:MAG: beta-lactamase [Thiomonas sp.]|nr:beta-lactamase [Thiomonas sp.]
MISRFSVPHVRLIFAAVSLIMASKALASAPPADHVTAVTQRVVEPLMRAQDIPGMSVGILMGDRTAVMNFGVASKASGKPVNGTTLFEVGSITKLLTATMASWAVAQHRMRLSDTVGKFFPGLRSAPIGRVPVIDLATQTSGGLPLQVPDGVRTQRDLHNYLRRWEPGCPPGTCRTYSNVGIGLLGEVAARSMGHAFPQIMQKQLLPALGMRHTYLDVPREVWRDYAQGYTKLGAPIRMKPGLLADEAYGIRTTAADLLHFVELNLDPQSLPPSLRTAMEQTRIRYVKSGSLTQDLVWEQVPYPTPLSTLLAANSAEMIYKTTPATPLAHGSSPDDAVWINKTGSTNGFSAYVAWIPERKLGIVMLANKNYPLDAEVTAAHAILSAVDQAMRVSH